MIKDNQKSINQFHVVLDGLVIAVSYVLAQSIMIDSDRFASKSGVLPPGTCMAALLLTMPIYLMLYSIFRLFTPKCVQGRRMEFTNVCKADILGALVFTTLLFLGNKNPYTYSFSRRMVLLFALVNTILETAERDFIRTTFHLIRSKGYSQKHILLASYSQATEGFIDRIQQSSEWGYQVRGILDDNRERGSEYKGVRVIGTIPNLDMILGQSTLNEIATALSIDEHMELGGIVSSCKESRVHTKFIPDYNNIIPTRPCIKDLQGLPVINVHHVLLNDALSATIKGLVSISGSLAEIIVLSSVMLLMTVIIRYMPPGPIIYKREQVGLHSRVFKMYRFRSMKAQHLAAKKSEQAKPRDPRVTPIGKFIRKISTDETPQFFNVLFGSMSLVGPRPKRLFFAERFKEGIPRYMIKHQVRPGMTGQAQVSGLRRDTSITKRIEYDLYCIESWTLGFDFKILFLTVFKGLINKNVYQSEVRRMSFDYDDELEHIEVDEGAWEKAFGGERSGTRVSKRMVDEDAKRKARTNARSMARQQKIARNKHRRRIIIAIAAEALTLMFIFGYAYMYKVYSRPQRLESKEDNTKNTELSVDDIKKMKGYWMIAIFGMGSRGTNVGKGTNANVNMIACTNRDTGDIELVSVYRDSHLNTDDKGSYNEVNQACAIGGPEQAAKTLDKNLDLNITDYITFNWKGVVDTISILDGVDVGITKSEFKYINSFITETVKTTRIGSHQLKSSRMNHLDGIQMVVYGRPRLMDTGFVRTERQREIIQLAFEKAKVADYSMLDSTLMVMLPQMATSLSFSDLTSVALNITRYKFGKTRGFPTAKGDTSMDKEGLCVIPQTLEGNVVELYKSLFGDGAYTTTDTVKKISAKISLDTGMYSQGKSQTGSQILKDKDEPETSATRETTTEEKTSRKVEADEYDNPIISGPFEANEDGNVIPNFTTGNRGSSSDESKSGPGDNESSSANVNRPAGSTMPGQTRPTGPADLPTSPTSATKPKETATPETTSGGPKHNNKPMAPVPSTSFGPVATEPEVMTSASPNGNPGGSSGGNTGGSPGGTPGTTSSVSSGDTPGGVVGSDGPG